MWRYSLNNFFVQRVRNVGSNVAFSIFDGDIKDGSSFCDDSQYTNAIDRFNLFKKPLMYIPGDNEWTDCHRTNNDGYNNLERLTHIRQVMFNTPYSFGQKKMKLEHQGALAGDYAENTRWTRGKVVFVGLNMPGSNNNKVNTDSECTNKSARSLEDCKADNAEYLARDAANIAFLKESFQKAKASKARGLVITIQGDPSFDLPETESFNERSLPGFDGFTNFLTVLADETGKFGGEIVLVHGDVHFFKIDKPLVDQAHLVKNFTRVETFGSPNVHWIKVSVNPYSRNLFTFEPMMVSGN
ncbi:conserved hypothetical protein [Crenothrix polyspora]|uniref:Calcineurin-like phosphoesterase domain-containing protein n=2 Tax=Crenothrix polyspora TaxID=360316 RepID=A0A1R4H3N0_9GAMM|nr:conserved hypothetical protein [Crenothrix polyspora]